MCNIYNQLGTPGTVKIFLGGFQFFKAMFNSFDLCSTHFSRGGEKFCRGFLITGLNICLKSNLQKGNSNACKYSYFKGNTSNFSLILPEGNVVSFMYFQVPVDPNVPTMGT